MKKTVTFTDGPGVLVTFLSTGPQLKKIVLLQTEQAISINVDHLKDVRQHLPVARPEQHRETSGQDCINMPISIKISTYPSIHHGDRSVRTVANQPSVFAPGKRQWIHVNPNFDVGYSFTRLTLIGGT